jgi:Periplasmic protease
MNTTFALLFGLFVHFSCFAQQEVVKLSLNEKEDSIQDNYTITGSTISRNLEKYKISQLQEDFDILKNAYIETKVGLWYNTYAEFDSISKIQRAKIEDQMTAWDFYKIVAPLTAYTKEGHSFIKVSQETNDYFSQYGTYFPLSVKILDKKLYVLNDYQNVKVKGLIITKINGISSSEILDTFTEIEPSDGYNFTSKYRWIESAFSNYLLRFYGLSESFTIEFFDSKTNKESVQIINAINSEQYKQLQIELKQEYPESSYSQPAEFEINDKDNLAKLTINRFGEHLYKGGKEGFKDYLDSVFLEINDRNMKNLIIDLRKNEGGTQGMEDILLSYLTTKDYEKYSYVEIPSFEYSFLSFTDYKDKKEVLKEELSIEFDLQNDGRYLDRMGVYDGLSPDPIHFNGDIYILIGGRTFSGGSEFAALAKNYTEAIFIGEETGGGYYGNTSGSYLMFTLPNTQLTGRIPLCKYVVNTNITSIPFGRGLIPDYAITPTIDDILNHNDAELNFTIQLISKK